MTATQTSAVMRQWDTQWILKTTILKYYRCPAPDTKSTAGLKNLSCCLKSLWQKFLTNPNLPGPMWKYPVYAHLSYISLVYLCLMLKFVWRSKNVWKICKNKQTRQGTNTFWHCCRDACLSKGLRQCQLHSGRHMRSSQSMFRVEQLCFFAGLQ